VRWQKHQVFCAWRAGALEGLIDAAVGLDSDNSDLPDYSPLGLLRFLLLPSAVARIDEVARLLLTTATNFWRGSGVGRVKAFHLSTGYPEFQAGLGALPGDWHHHIRVLTAHDYQFTERFYGLLRPLDQPLEETLPRVGLSLVLRGKPTDRHYQLYRQAVRIGEARVAALTTTSTTATGVPRTMQIANLLALEIDHEWRGQGIGRWLLRRLINDATVQGYQQMLVHIPHRAFAMQNLLIQHGFQEQSYRCYTLETTLRN
jgi:ribosomal protein S18 acetylase RimI-like enzyme